MVSIEIIGNLGADAEIKDYQGAKFVSFNVCDNRKVGEKEISQWYGCTLNKWSDKLLPYLRKGQCVFLRGIPRYRVFDSALHRCKMVAVDVMVNEIQLVGAAPALSDQEPKAELNQNNVEIF